MAEKKINRTLSILPSEASLAYLAPAGNTKKYGEQVRETMAAYYRCGSSSGEDILSAGSVALHVISGMVTFQSWWRFSTAAFIDELKKAEENERIKAHLLIIDSPGGEIFSVHEAWQAIRACKKPVYALCREYCASAAYWIASACSRIYAESPLTSVGCIGVMAVLVDDTGALEKEGIKVMELYAHGSGDKNKLSRDAVEGNQEPYITERLDPILKVMLEDIKSGRNIKDDNDALTGKVYFAEGAKAVSLIDGIASLQDVLAELEPSAPPRTDINNLNLF